MTTTQDDGGPAGSVSQSAWDEGWAKFKAWLAKHPEVAEEHDEDVCEQIRLWSESPEYTADLASIPSKEPSR